MRIATWNINSVRLRIDLVTKFLNESDIDVLCLQETKTEDKFFPSSALADTGWNHHAFRGEKSYNGVAIISRLPLGQVHHKDWAKKIDCRHICVQIENGPSIHNFYVPAGGDVPDREEFSVRNDPPFHGSKTAECYSGGRFEHCPPRRGRMVLQATVESCQSHPGRDRGAEETDE